MAKGKQFKHYLLMERDVFEEHLHSIKIYPLRKVALSEDDLIIPIDVDSILGVEAIVRKKLVKCEDYK